MIQQRVARTLAEAGIPDAARDARRLYDWAYALGAEAPEPQDRDHPNEMTLHFLEIGVAQRLKRQPVSQIVGKRAFWRHEFDVTPDVLDPRPDTETLVDQALGGRFSRVLDLGTGTGCIVISLLAERATARGVAVDLSEAALTVARRNARRIGVSDRLELTRSDWFSAVEGSFDLIVSNPPYIAAEEMPDLAPEVRDWEPRLALTDEGDGLTAYRIIAREAAGYLNPEGLVMVEIGPSQGAAVSGLFRAAGYTQVEVIPDLDGRDRVVLARDLG
ncbi:peptide chain release factor N(5)-glutamine methyltransferase [Pseudooceanicola sp.]|uniref:peptide chain release factor N(5)-glutamine methyltransferase n=1 Tax=Pseudooceanicola sp. TaxID=1914328 RepID=UPI0035C697C8